MNQSQIGNYYVATAMDPDALSETVKTMLTSGWQPVGPAVPMLHENDSITGNQYVWAQTMVRHQVMEVEYCVLAMPVIDRQDEVKFSTEINLKLKQGWQLHGSSSLADFNALQALVRYTPSTTRGEQEHDIGSFCGPRSAIEDLIAWADKCEHCTDRVVVKEWLTQVYNKMEPKVAAIDVGIPRSVGKGLKELCDSWQEVLNASLRVGNFSYRFYTNINGRKS